MPWPSVRLTRTVSRPSWSTMHGVVGVHAVEVGDERVDVDERMPRVDAEATARRRERAVDVRRDRARPLEVGGVVDLDRVVGMHGLDADAPEEAVARLEEALGAEHVERAGLGVLGRAVLPARAVRRRRGSRRRRRSPRRRARGRRARARPRTRRRVRPTRPGSIAASRSAGSMNGDVAWTNTTRPSAPGASSPSASRACSSADSLEAVAPASSAGRATISAPASRAASAIASSSVLTTTRPIRSAASAACTARATSGTPPTRARFLPGRPCEPPRAGMIAVARATGVAASGAPIAPRRTRAVEGASRRSAWVVMPRSYAARADGRCTPGERRATVRSTVDGVGAGAAEERRSGCRRRTARGIRSCRSLPVQALLGRLHDVREQHRAGHRPDAAGVRREIARDLGDAGVDVAREAAPCRSPSSCTRVTPTSSTAAPGLIQSGCTRCGTPDRRDDDVGAAHLGREVAACASA